MGPAASGGGTGTAGGETFSLYPFTNGKTLVAWGDDSTAHGSALLEENYVELPPLLTVPATAMGNALMLLVGRVEWNPLFATLPPLTPAQLTTLSHLTTRHADILAAAAPHASAPGVVIETPKHFFRLRRMEADGDHDDLDWFTETLLGTDPNNPDSDLDGIPDGREVAAGTDPNRGDTDGDQVEDGVDAYPNDPNRSKDLDVLHYAAIAASEGITNEVLGVALGGGAKIGFWWSASPTEFGAAVWENGTVAPAKNVRYKIQYEKRDPETHSLLETWNLSAAGVSSDGWLAGTATRSYPAGVMKAAFLYRPDGPRNATGDIEPALSQKAVDTVCLGITPGGVIWGRRQNIVDGSMDTDGGYTYWNYRLTYPVTFIGADLFPGSPPVTLDESTAGHPFAVVQWGERGDFAPMVLGFGGQVGAGDYSAPDPLQKTRTPLPPTPDSADPPIVLPVPGFKPATMSFWRGDTDFVTVFPPDADTVSVVATVSDTPEGVGTSSRLTPAANATAGATHLFAGPAGPPDIYTKIAPVVVKQIRTQAALAESPDGKVLLGVDSLEGPGSGQWVARKLLLVAGAEPCPVELAGPPASSRLQLNAAKYLGRLNGGKAEILLPVEVRAFQDEDGPHGSPPMYAPPRPDDGQPFGDLFSLWPSEKATFRIGDPIATMLAGNQLPAGTVKWTGDDIAEQVNVGEIEVQYWTPGLKQINLQIGTSIFHLYVNVPDTKNLDFIQPSLSNPDPPANQAVKDAIGRFDYDKILWSGLQMRTRVEQRYGQTGATGGTRQDAIRHSSWNAFAAEQVGKAKTILLTTANEFHGQYFGAAFASNCTMDLHNNDVGATAGNAYFGTTPLKFPEEIIDEMEAKFDAGELWAWTPPNANVNTHWHILKKSNRSRIFPQ